MKKKIAAYTATAILLGVAIMMLPQTLKAGQPRYFTPTAETNTPQNFAVAGPSMNFFPISLIVVLGLIVALISYVLLKRRIR
jgi:predicted cobalt transporter CbtA